MSEIYGESLTFAGGRSNIFAYIVATYIAGHNCTCSGNGKVLTAPTNTGYWVFGVDGPGEYILTDVEYNISTTVNVTSQYQVIRNTIVPQWLPELKTAAIGSMVIVDGYEWLVVHKTYLGDTPASATLALRYWYTNTTFGSNKTYAGSVLANQCATFESNTLSVATKAFLNNVTVEGVTAKVFIPTKAQFEGGFSCYATQSNRIFYTDNSFTTAKQYWTSTAGGTVDIWTVYTDGYIYSSAKGASFGFRPHIEVNLTL